MTSRPLHLVVLGLSLSSSWGNGHATTYRALLRAFAGLGHRVTFLEREQPWYAANRDLREADFCRLAFYDDLAGLDRHRAEIATADAVLVGSYVPDGIAVGRFVQAVAGGVTAFYDIDTPVTLAQLEAGECRYLAPELIPGYDLYLSFTGGPTLDRLMQGYGARAARQLYCSVDQEAYAPRPTPPRWDLGYLGTYSLDRQPALERLLLEPARQAPDLRFVVAGPQYPADIRWPGNVERIEHLPPSEHAAFYAASRFTLNVTRENMRRAGFSPSVRLFEAAACGVPLISDTWPGLETLFEPGREIVLAESADEVLTTLRSLPEERRAAIGAAARQRVLASHTSQERARELERLLRAAPQRAPQERRRSRSRPSRQAVPVLVAGGAGFLGSHLCDALIAEGRRVVCLDNLQTGRTENLAQLRNEPRFELIEADIVDPLPPQLRCASIFNLACAASPPHYQADPEHTLLTCVLGTRNLLRLAESCRSPLLLASTSEVYGDPDVHPQPESYRGAVNCTGPRACYDEGKRAAETLAFDFARAGRAAVRVARIFNTYGPRMRADDGRVVSNVIVQALAGEDITLYGDGSQTRSFCYVADLIDGLLRLMRCEGQAVGPVNLGNPVETSVGELARRIQAMTGSASRLVRRPLPVDDPRRRRPDAELARRLLGWSAATPLEEGLRQTISWFAAQCRRDEDLGRSESRLRTAALDAAAR